MTCRAGARLFAILVLLLWGMPRADALHSYPEVAQTLQALASAPPAPGGPTLKVVTIGHTVRGRPILMAVLSVPQAAAPEETQAPDARPTLEAGGEASGPADVDAANATPPPGALDGAITLTLEPTTDRAVLPRVPEMEASAENREVRRLLVICRQHGNEPATTEAAMRLLKEYATTDDPSRLALLRRVTLLVVPMLNVDGAERGVRRNARNVDLNRDWERQTQPETRAVVAAIREWRPDLIVDAHELHPTDWTPDFVEELEREGGAPAEVGEASNAATAAVVGQLRAQSLGICARPVFNYRAPRLAHRYFAIQHGVPSILVETRRAGGVPISRRIAIHYQALLTAARHLAGEAMGTPSRIIEAWLEQGSVREYRLARGGSRHILARRSWQLASRGGFATRVEKKRAELRRKTLARKRLLAGRTGFATRHRAGYRNAPGRKPTVGARRHQR